MSSEPAPARRGILFILSAPSGAGKSTLTQGLMAATPGLAFSVSTTTRSIRGGEIEGVDYHYTDRATFLAMVERGEFIEHAEVHGNLYGTRWATVREALARGTDLLLDIDVQGGAQIRSLVRDPARAGEPIQAALVFVMPPSLGVLEERLKRRGTDSPEVIARRLRNAEEEIRRGKDYDYIVVNDTVEKAVRTLREIVDVERLKAAVAPRPVVEKAGA